MKSINNTRPCLLTLYLFVSLPVISCSAGDSSEDISTNSTNCLELNECISDTNNENDTHIDNTFYIGAPTNITQKAYMHYLPWFAEGITGNHWEHGVVNIPLIGYYDSKAWATHLYHILLSSLAGIDGAIINVRTVYDQEAFDIFVESLKRIEDIYPEFDYAVSISYDDQNMTEQSARLAMTHLKNNVISQTSKYLYKDGSPVIFIWNYDGYLTSQDYRYIANDVFPDTPPILLQNDLDLTAAANDLTINSFYPWVKGFSEDGSHWGEDYINWFYATSADFELNNKIQYVLGAVWPGFDDRQASWGKNRWIDRNDGLVYQTLWDKINTSTTGINWVILETWNDFNEGSELEPIIGDDSYQYIKLTADNVARYKGTVSNIDNEHYMLIATIEIYKAAKLIEGGDRNYNTYYPKLEDAIERFLQKKALESIRLSQEIAN